MAKYTGADCKRCRREGCKLFLKGDRCVTGKCAIDRRPTAPGQHGEGDKRRKPTGYQLQLREKQKVKRAYGLLEKQFKKYYFEGKRQKGATGEVMLSLLERRLDNTVYRLGFGVSRTQCRQIVNHGHIAVNGKKVNIPSYQVKVGDVISIRENSQNVEMFKELKKNKTVTPKWLELDASNLSGKVVAIPERSDIDLNIAEHLIIELYSR
ncbi:MAG: 30S ribosomal protein S4 [Clostridia bacterium]|nr:30S ribosomal protein S4 [Clostridia bacterium]